MRWALLFALLSSPACAGDRSAPLSLEQARALLSAVGVNVGKVFADEPGSPSANRYALTRLDSKQKRPNVFVVEIEVTPLPRGR